MPDRPTVLIVEDEALLLEVAAMEFEDAGYEVLTARDGAAAMQLLDGASDVDLLFTDIRMPGKMDGWELARQARSRRSSLPVIYATGYSSEAPDTAPGCVLFLKPYSMTEVLAAARSLL
jgi:CheY-like chemotaxis protein